MWALVVFGEYRPADTTVTSWSLGDVPLRALGRGYELQMMCVVLTCVTFWHSIPEDSLPKNTRMETPWAGYPKNSPMTVIGMVPLRSQLMVEKGRAANGSVQVSSHMSQPVTRCTTGMELKEIFTSVSCERSPRTTTETVLLAPWPWYASRMQTTCVWLRRFTKAHGTGPRNTSTIASSRPNSAPVIVRSLLAPLRSQSTVEVPTSVQPLMECTCGIRFTRIVMGSREVSRR
mmetsp:Transcript_70810/g.118420  ORF Transcript_70810/g.118420 Transcript_70810/m.118420 type:complete len:232 (+) Transcript_70810:671-1366(+)